MKASSSSARARAGPTRLVRAPWVEEAEQLDDDLVRIRARATVAYGREWLVETFLPDLLKEREIGRAHV